MSRRLGQLVLSADLLGGLLGLEAGAVLAVQQSDGERRMGTLRVIVESGRLAEVPKGNTPPVIELEDVQE